MYKHGTVLNEFERITKERMEEAQAEMFVSAFLFHIIEEVNTLEAAIKRNEYRDRMWGNGVIRDLYKAQLDTYYSYINSDTASDGDRVEVDKDGETD